MASWIIDGSEKRGGTCSVSSSNGMPVLNETYNFIIESDSKYTSRIDILYSTPSFPKVNQTVSAYGLAVCVGVDATRREDNPFIWDASATFSSEVEEGQDGSSGGQDPAADPVTWVPIRETKFERLQEVVTKDKNDDAVANSSGQAYQTGLTVGRFIPIWEFWQFEPATVTDEQLIARNETVNDATFKTKPAKSFLLTVLSSKVGYYYGQRRRLTHYSLKYNEKLWTHKRLDVGSLWKQNGSSNLIDPRVDNPTGQVIALNGSGQPASGYDGATNKPGLTITAPAIREFDIYQSISFSFLRV